MERGKTGSLFKVWRKNRELYLDFFDNCSSEQLNQVPDGFNNNIIWNIGHVVVAQQALIYKLSEVPWYISNELYHLYKPGTKPTQTTTQEEVEELKRFLISLIEKTETDFAAGKFIKFNERMTATGFLLSSFSDALEFNNYHEGLHLGVARSIARFV